MGTVFFGLNQWKVSLGVEDTVTGILIEMLAAILTIAIAIFALYLQKQSDKFEEEERRQEIKLRALEEKDFEEKKRTEQETQAKLEADSDINIEGVKSTDIAKNIFSDYQSMPASWYSSSDSSSDDLDDTDFDQDTFDEFDSLETEEDYKVMGYESKEDYDFDTFLFDKMMYDHFHKD